MLQHKRGFARTIHNAKYCDVCRRDWLDCRCEEVDTFFDERRFCSKCQWYHPPHRCPAMD